MTSSRRVGPATLMATVGRFQGCGAVDVLEHLCQTHVRLICLSDFGSL